MGPWRKVLKYASDVRLFWHNVHVPIVAHARSAADARWARSKRRFTSSQFTLAKKASM